LRLLGQVEAKLGATIAAALLLIRAEDESPAPTGQKSRPPAAGGSVKAIMTKGARGFDLALFPNYTLTNDGINKMRRRVRSGLFTRTRTATRTFDLQLAIATLRLSALWTWATRIWPRW
jgi:hypothetical protein